MQCEVAAVVTMQGHHAACAYSASVRTLVIIIIIKLPDQAIASTPSAPLPPGAEERGTYSSILLVAGTCWSADTLVYQHSHWLACLLSRPG
jgi:hypothetical protein